MQKESSLALQPAWRPETIISQGTLPIRFIVICTKAERKVQLCVLGTINLRFVLIETIASAEAVALKVGDSAVLKQGIATDQLHAAV